MQVNNSHTHKPHIQVNLNDAKHLKPINDSTLANEAIEFLATIIPYIANQALYKTLLELQNVSGLINYSPIKQEQSLAQLNTIISKASATTNIANATNIMQTFYIILRNNMLDTIINKLENELIAQKELNHSSNYYE